MSDQFHLSDEEAGSIVDGTISRGQRARFIEHISACDDCFELVSEAAYIAHQTEVNSLTIGPRRKIILLAGSLAAAAVIAIFVLTAGKSNYLPHPVFRPSAKITNRPSTPKPADTRTPSPRLQPDETVSSPAAQPLEKDYLKIVERYRRLPSAVVGPEPNLTYSFTGNQLDSSLAFHAGADLAMLELALVSGDRRLATASVDRFIAGLRPFHDSRSLIRYYEKMRSTISTDNPATGQYSRVEKFFDENQSGLHFKFGEWTQCALFAANSRDPSFFDVHDIQYFRKELASHGTIAGAIKNLNDVEKLIAKNKLRKRDWEQLQLLLKDTIELM